ncbi:MAG: hypothetical protein Q9163_002426 [Psora crenata]
MSSDTQDKKKIFINLPVRDLTAASAFYTAIGFTANHKFADANSLMMVLSPSIHVMLLTHEFFGGFVPAGRTICDANQSTEVLVCMSAESREEVDQLVHKAAAAGGKADVGFKQVEEGGMMYGRSFQDLDGHVWEVMWMADEGCCGGEGKAEKTEKAGDV